MAKQRNYFILIDTLLILAIIIHYIPNVLGEEKDWSQNCGICNCTWKYGKKTVNCKSKSLNAIPNEFSSELQVIDLSDNKIPIIKNDVFFNANLQNLHNIIMKNCLIEEVNQNAFNGLAVLFALDLSFNSIESLEVGTFDNLKKLSILILNNNNLRVLPQLIFSNLPILSRLEFKNNHLKIVENGAFKDLNALLTINLENNSLSILDKHTFEHIPKLIELSLSQNPWNCSCELKEFKEFVVQNKLYTPSTTCHEPTKFAGVRWTEISSDSFACKPYILYPSNNHNIEVTHENVTLKCRVNGTPTPTIIWLFKGRLIETNLHRTQIRNTENIMQNSTISELKITNITLSDMGSYVCRAENSAGSKEVIINIKGNSFISNNVTSSTNSVGFVCIIIILSLIVATIIGFAACIYIRMKCSGSQKQMYRKHPVLHSSVIVDMQGKTDLLDESSQFGNKIKSVEIANIASEEKQPTGNSYEYQHLPTESFHIDNALPPDLLSFPPYTTSRSNNKDSLSQIPHDLSFSSNPESSPIYNRYITTPNYMRTVNRVHSPFNQAPIIYSPLVVKQQYMTIPRKSRAPSWAYPSCSPSPVVKTSRRQSTSDYLAESEPVYDNLGLRTTAGGNSTLNLKNSELNKVPFKYTMKDRPLPATPLISKETDNNLIKNAKIYEPIEEINSSDKYVMGNISKLPPRPPPKPIKKNIQINPKCEFFEDEDENGTEV